MIHFFFSSIMLIALIPYVLISIFPIINKNSYFWLTSIFYVIYLVIFYVVNSSKFINLFKFKKESYLLMLYKILLIFALTFFSWYYMFSRWNFEPFGMWDAWLMWNLKAKSLTTNLLQNSTIKLFDTLWYHNDYPLTFPVLNTSIAISIGGWSEFISYFLNFFLLFLSMLIFLESISKNFLITPTILLILFVINPNYLNLASDLCADHFLSLSLLYLMYTFKNNLINSDKPKFSKVSIIFALISISTIKNEGLLYAIIAIFLLIFSLILINKKNILLEVIKLFALLIFISFLAWIWKYYVYEKMHKIDSDFIFLGLNHFNYLAMKEEYLKYIWKTFLKFHIFDLKGILLFSLGYLIFFANNYLTKIMAIYILILFIVLNFLFLFSKDVIWLLSTAYVRINIVLLPAVLYLFIINGKEYFNSESFYNFIKGKTKSTF